MKAILNYEGKTYAYKLKGSVLFCNGEIITTTANIIDIKKGFEYFKKKGAQVTIYNF